MESLKTYKAGTKRPEATRKRFKGSRDQAETAEPTHRTRRSKGAPGGPILAETSGGLKQVDSMCSHFLRGSA